MVLHKINFHNKLYITNPWLMTVWSCIIYGLYEDYGFVIIWYSLNILNSVLTYRLFPCLGICTNVQFKLIKVFLAFLILYIYVYMLPNLNGSFFGTFITLLGSGLEPVRVRDFFLISIGGILDQGPERGRQFFFSHSFSVWLIIVFLCSSYFY